MRDRIQVIIAEHETTRPSCIRGALIGDARLHVAGYAGDVTTFLRLLEKYKPDIAVLDSTLAFTSECALLRRVMKDAPLPIVVAETNYSLKTPEMNAKILNAGALAIVNLSVETGESQGGPAMRLVQTVRAMSEVKVVGRRLSSVKVSKQLATWSSPIRLVAVGTSTGGPIALQSILSALPRDFSVPLVIVQHIAPGFIEGLAHWLAETTGFTTRVAKQGESLKPGVAYLAPDYGQMGITVHHQLQIDRTSSSDGPCPCIDYLFRSVRSIFGPCAAGVLLTGMGRDGAVELKAMRTGGALTIAQDEESCVVYGMPREAALMDAAEFIKNPPAIAALLREAVGPGSMSKACNN